MSEQTSYPESLNAAVELIDKNVERWGDNVAIYYDESPLNRGSGKITYRQLMELTNKMGNVLRELGLRPNDRICMMMYNSYEFIVSFYGAIKAGIVPVPIATMLPPDQIGYILHDCRAQAIILSDFLTESFRRASSIYRLKWLRHAIVVGYAEGGFLSYDDLMKEASTQFEYEPMNKDEMCFILYTSGTTGPAKGAVHLQHDLLWIADHYAKYVCRVTENDVWLSTWPMFFAAGLCPATCFSHRFGASCVAWPGNPPGKLTPEDFFELIERYKVTIFGSVPTFLIRMLAIKDAEKTYDLKSLRLIVSGAEPLIPTIVEEFKRRFNVDVIDGCGSTEALHIYMSGIVGAKSIGCKPVPGFEIKLVDEHGNEIKEPNKSGRLLLKGDSIAAFYWNKHEKTKELIKGEWFETGDIWVMDKDGFYWYLGRVDEMIRQRGFWISPKRVEDALSGHPAVLEVAAVQSYDEHGLPIGKVFVVLREEYKPSDELAKELREYMKQRLARHEVPMAVEFIDALPRLPTGKVSRLILKQREEELRRKRLATYKAV